MGRVTAARMGSIPGVDSVDLLELARHGIAARSTGLGAGTRTDTLADELGRAADTIHLDAIPGGMGHCAIIDDYCVLFDSSGALAGIGYGYAAGDTITPQVANAVLSARSPRHTDPAGDATDGELGIGPRIALRLAGQSLPAFATLPHFIATLEQFGDGDLPPARLSSRPDDQWIRADFETGHGVLAAEFLLATLPGPPGGRALIDYCLYGISFTSHALLAPPAAAGTPD